MKKLLQLTVIVSCAITSRAQLTFPLATFYGTGSNPNEVSTPISLCSADFNTDGIKDMAIANFGANKIAILTGLGGGFFSPPVEFAGAYNPYYVISADFNNDNNMDLAAGNGNVAAVSIYLGDGLGGFSAALNNFSVGVVPVCLFSADFNGDGNADIVTANNNSNTLSVLLGAGNGSFSLSATVAVGIAPSSVYSVDFNGDNFPDLVASNGNANHISVSLGNGNGTFSAAVSYTTGFGPTGVTCAFVNNDNFIDIVSCNYDVGTLSVFLGNGNGTFAAATSFATGLYPLSIAKADFDGDGNIDIATAGFNLDTITVALGDGSGNFSAPYNFNTLNGSQGLISDDFNADGKPDIASTHPNFDSVSVLLNGTPFPLPVMIKSFTGNHKAGRDILEWVSENENNNAFYTLQHSKDSRHFSDIATLFSQATEGSNSASLAYTYTNVNPSKGHNYYRLQQTDADGKSVIHAKMLDIVNEAAGFQLNLFPNPASDKVEFDFTVENATSATIKLTDMKGSTVKNMEINFKKGFNTYTLDISALSAGIYLLEVNNDSDLNHQQLIRKN